MATFWFADGAEGLAVGATMANIGRYTGTLRPVALGGTPPTRHGFGQMYSGGGSSGTGILVPVGLRAINVAAAVYRDGFDPLVSISTTSTSSSITGPSIDYTGGMLIARGLGGADVAIGSWTNNAWVHVEIAFYYEDTTEGGNGSGYARYYVNGALAYTRSYDSSFANFNDYTAIMSANVGGTIIDDIVVRGSSISGFQTQIGDVRIETFVAPSLGNADGDTSFDTIASGDESAYGVTVSPVGSVSGSYRATIVEAIAKKGEASEPVYVKPRIIGVTPYGNDFGEAAADGTYISYSGGGDYVTVSGAQSLGVLVDTVP